MYRITLFFVALFFVFSVSTASAQGPTVELMNQYSTKCLAVKGASKAHGAALILKECRTGGLDASWEMRSAGLNYKIFNKNSGLCLGVEHQVKYDGVRVTQVSSCDNRKDTLWTIENAQPNPSQQKNPLTPQVDYGKTIVVKNINSGRCMALGTGDEIKQYWCDPPRVKLTWKIVEPWKPPTAYKRVFVTSATYKSDFLNKTGGDVAGADKICQDIAGSANLTGTYRAWLSVYEYGKCEGMLRPERGLSSNVGAAAVPYMNICGSNPVKIADNFYDLVDGYLAHPISCTEKGLRFSGTPGVWTGTRTDGRIAHYENCKKGKCSCRFIIKMPDDGCCLADCCMKYTTTEFKSKGGTHQSLLGNAGTNDKNWTQYQWVNCHGPEGGGKKPPYEFRLYCFEQ